MRAPEPIEIEEAQVERLIEQAQQGRLDAAAQKRIVPLTSGPCCGFSAPCSRRASAWRSSRSSCSVSARRSRGENPNSRLGGAFDYLLKRWKALTGFLHIPGAPLDNNAAERVLKMILRYRKNSLFYKNAHGASVGDVLTSLIETCRLAGANPLDYLRALMENRSAVFADPAAWLPWNYRETRQSPEQRLPLSRPPPILGHPGVLGVAVPQ